MFRRLKEGRDPLLRLSGLVKVREGKPLSTAIISVNWINYYQLTPGDKHLLAEEEGLWRRSLHLPITDHEKAEGLLGVKFIKFLICRGAGGWENTVVRLSRVLNSQRVIGQLGACVNYKGRTWLIHMSRPLVRPQDPTHRHPDVNRV